MQFPDDLDRQQGKEIQRLSLLRKLIHVALAVVPLAGWWISFETALGLAGILVAGSIAAEILRRRLPGTNHALRRLLPSVFREWEKERILGSTWFAVGALAALALWGRDAGGTAILFLAWGDPAAEFVGRHWGGKGEAKTVVGSLGCFAACLVAGLVGMGLGGLSPWAVVGGAVVATLVERWPPPPDDNLWIPVLAGLAVAAGGLVG